MRSFLWIFLAGLLCGFDIDPVAYSRLKSKGIASVEKLGNDVVVRSKQFDPETGVVRPDRRRPVVIQELLARRNSLQQQLSSVNELISDIQALP